jgi:hypothetical protein
LLFTDSLGIWTMKATDFEYHRQTSVHQFIVATAFLTYLVDREDVVWRFVKDTAAPRLFERFFFVLATVFILAGAAICTWARAHRRPEGTTGMESYRHLHQSRYIGDLLYAIGLASLAPSWGFIILVAGEALRVFRLTRYEEHLTQNFPQHSLPTASLGRPFGAQDPHSSGLVKAFRQEAVKWGLFVTMVVFVITLKDRLAEVLAAASFLIGLLVNAPIFSHIPNTAE